MIRGVTAMEAYDGAGWPAIEVTILTDEGAFKASATIMVSSGPYEGINVYDENPLQIQGKGIELPVRLINEIAQKALAGFECTDQIYLDKRLVENLDGSRNAFGWSCSKIGRNTIAAISQAIAKAGAARRKLPLSMYLGFVGDCSISRCRIPRPMISVISGGLLEGSLIPVESIFIIPHSRTTFADAIRIGWNVNQRVKQLLIQTYGTTALALSEDGAFSPLTANVEGLLQIVNQAILDCGEGDCSMGMDIAASTFFVNGAYDISWKLSDHLAILSKAHAVPMTTEQPEAPLPPAVWRHRLTSWLKSFPIELIIDPIALETAHSLAYQGIVREFGDTVTIAMQRSLGSQPLLVDKFSKDLANGIVVAPAQVASVTEVLASIRATKNNGVPLIISCANHENDDSFVADLAVGVSADFIKIGGLQRGERVSKINQLLRIEEMLSKVTYYADFQ